MEEFIKERNGGRRFERISRWNLIDYTIISKNNRFAQYADDADSGKDKLAFTYFKLRNHTYPLNMFGKLMESIELEDHTKISRQNVEDNNYFLEVSPDKTKVRVYKLA